MKYYRVTPENDNAPRFRWGTGRKAGYVIRDGILVGNELYTPAERAKIANHKYFFEEVEIKKSNIYFFFGARFEKGAKV